jgi:hypothetical protein
VIAYIMAMKILNPNKWWLIRGNHETREVNGNIEHYQVPKKNASLSPFARTYALDLSTLPAPHMQGVTNFASYKLLVFRNSGVL